MNINNNNNNNNLTRKTKAQQDKSQKCSEA